MKLRCTAVLALLALCALGAHAAADDQDDEFGDIADLEAVEEVVQEPVAPATPAPKAAEAAGADSSAEPEAPTLTALAGTSRTSYEWEILGLTAALVYVGVYVWGRHRNAAIAEEFHTTMKPWLTAQFAEVGVGGDDGSPFTKVSQNEFRLFATGRRGCEGLILTLQLAPRQDLLSHLIAIVAPSTWRDIVVLDALMLDMPPFVLGVLPVRGAKGAHKDTADLRDFGTLVAKPAAVSGVRAPEGALSSFAFVTDASEVLGSLLTAPLVEALAAHGPPPPGASRKSEPGGGKGKGVPPGKRSGWFVNAHFTDNALMADMGGLALTNTLLRFTFALPAPGAVPPQGGEPALNWAASLALLKPLVALVPAAVDAVARLRLSKKATAHNLSLRKEVLTALNREAEEERQEAAREAKAKAAEAEHAKLLAMTDASKASKALRAKAKKAQNLRMRKARTMAKK